MWKILEICVLVVGLSQVHGAMFNEKIVAPLTSSNIDAEIKKSDAGKVVNVVAFTSAGCGHCRNFAPEITRAATAFQNNPFIKVWNVDVQQEQQLAGRYQVTGLPTIIFFYKGSQTTYNGQRQAPQLIKAITDVITNDALKTIGAGGDDRKHDKSGGGGNGEGSVIELTDDNFDKLVLDSEDMWLVEFYAPWCGHCKNLAPHWKTAAKELGGKVKLGAVDATVHTLKASKYEIRGYPTIKFFAPGKKRADSVAEYDGGRTSNDIVQWALDKLSENIAAPEIVQITNEKVFKESCENKPLCVVSVLPHILDCQSSCRNEYIKILRSLGEVNKKKMWGWVWAEAGAQTELEETLEIGGFGYPAMAVVNIKKMKYSLLKGSFSSDGIHEFLRDIGFGRGSTAPLKGGRLPKIVESEAWDGKDGELPQDEDIDLSDVNLDDKDEL